MRKLQFAPKARADLIDIFYHIAGDNPARAASFVGEIEQRCGKLPDFPEAGRARPELAEGLRSVPHGRYMIYYSSERSVVRIERILHGSRDVGARFKDED